MADIPPRPEKPFVIFYDCCIPQAPFKNFVLPVLLFADHVFVRKIFPEPVCRKDDELFACIIREWQAHYPGRMCFVVTCDQNDFEEKTKHHWAYGKAARVMYLGPCNSKISNQLAARNLVSKITHAYVDLLIFGKIKPETLEH